MARSMRRRGRLAVSNALAPRVRLFVELLEDRHVMSAVAALAPGTFEPGHILVGDAAGQVHQIELASGVTVEQALADYGAKPGIAFAEPDYVVQVGLTPNDTYYGLEYGLNNIGQIVNGATGTADADIDAPEAWNITTGSVTTVVADIDTGIDYTHPDLYLNIWINQGEIPTAIRNSLTDTDGDGIITFYDLNVAVNQGPGKITDLNANGRIDGGDLLNNASGWENNTDNDGDGKIDDLIGWNFVSNTNDPRDDNGHGSHTAGTIGAIGNNGVGVTGVNWKVQIAAMKFLNAQGSGAISAAQSALQLSVAKGILISNNSWGGGGFSQSFLNALVAANNAGHVFIAAAGNAASNNDTTASYPANYNVANVISVAATNSNDQLASFSNYGVNTVDIAAPGVSIASTYSNGGYVYLDGTSMATPHVTGVVALERTLNPGLGVADTIGRILNGADVIAGLTGKVAGGRRLNAFNAVNVGPPALDLTGPRVTAAVPDGTTSVSSVRLTFSEAIDPGSFDAFDVANFGTLTVTGVAPVVGSGNTQFDVAFDPVTAPGSYGFEVGPDIADTAGNLMDQNADGANGGSSDAFHVSFTIAATETFTFFNSTPVQIRDLLTATSKITINRDITIDDLNVQLDITHTWDSDLYITLKSPTGQTVVLANRRGGSGDDFDNTLFNDEAATSISAGAAPFAGSFRPDGKLASFDGRNARGIWTLSVQDRGRGDVGTLHGWSLFITQGPSGASADDVGATGEGGADAIDASSAAPGFSGLTAFDALPGFGPSTAFVFNTWDDGVAALHAGPDRDAVVIQLPAVRTNRTALSASSRQIRMSQEVLQALFGEGNADPLGNLSTDGDVAE